MKNRFEKVCYPYLTEKATFLIEKNKYQFVIPLSVNKIEIKNSIESIYNVKVSKVNVSPIPTKMKKVRYHMGMTARRKKAVVTLKEGFKIDLI